MYRRAFVASACSALLLDRLRVWPLPSAAQAKTPYNNGKAIKYAKDFCDKENNSCGVYLTGGNKSDCAHFIAHCLAAGGIRVANPDATNRLCPDGLAVRNVDIEAELRRLAGLYSNVREQNLVWDAIVGDIGFLRVERPRHAFMVCEPVNTGLTPPPAVKAWAHSSKRCCEPLDAQWRQWFSSSFRLEDGP